MSRARPLRSEADGGPVRWPRLGEPGRRPLVMAGRVPTACTDPGNDPPPRRLIPSWPGLSGPSVQAPVPRQVARTSRAMTVGEQPGEPRLSRPHLKLAPIGLCLILLCTAAAGPLPPEPAGYR